jgi:hypothetical protein
MSEETKVAEPAPAGDPLEFYKSLSVENRANDGIFVDMAIANGVYPESIRYDVFRGGYRGVIKGIDGELFYFTLPPAGAFHIVQASDDTRKWEAQRLFKGCNSGCDLIRGKSADKKKDEEEEGKAVGASGGTMELPPASQPEEQNVATQTQQITQEHPGGAMGTTPQQDGSTERWHGQDMQRSLWTTIDLMKSWGQQLQQTAPKVGVTDPQLRTFCIEVLGKLPSEVDSGPVKLSGLQRAQYNQWLTKSLRGRMDGLTSWLQKVK